RPKPVPQSIAEAVLKGKAASKAAAAVLAALAIGLTALSSLPTPASAQEASAQEQPTPPRNSWSFAGPFGKFDRGQLQRGFAVYHEVCKTCHGLALLSFRNLAQEGGPE